MRPPAAGIALALPLLLLAAACGTKPGVFRPAGRAVGVASPAAAASRLSGPVPFPGALTFDFGPLPADPQQAALVTRDREFVLAYYEAVYRRGADSRYRSFIDNNGVLTAVSSSVDEHVAARRGFAGLDRFFDTTVTPAPGYPGEQDVSYCVDEAGLRSTGIASGRVLGSADQPGYRYYRETDTFAREKDGSWGLVGLLVTYYPKGQARECKP